MRPTYHDPYIPFVRATNTRRYPAQVVKPLIYHIQVGKKVSDGNYGGDEVSVLLQVNVPAGTDPASDQAQAVIANTIQAARRQVYAYHGIDEMVSVGQIKRSILERFDGDKDDASTAYESAVSAGVIEVDERVTPEHLATLHEWFNDHEEARA